MNDALGNVLSIYQQSYSHSGSDYYTQINQEDVLLQGAGGMYNPNGRAVEYKIAGSSGPATVTTAVLSGGGNYQEQLISLSGTTITLNSGSNTYDYSNYTAERTTNEKQFELPNHLGSVVTVTSDRKRAYDDGTPDGTVDRYVAEINSWSDTYAFGSVATGGVLLGSEYRYGFQGIEKGPEISTGAYEADFRMVDVRIGRWFSPDPIKKHWESPYACFKNNPVYYVDPSGLDATNGEGTPTGDEKKNQAKTGDKKGTISTESHKEENCPDCYQGSSIDVILNTGGGGSPGTNSNSGQSKDSYRKSGYNDSPYKLNLMGTPWYNPASLGSHLDIPDINAQAFTEGFISRLASNFTLTSSEVGWPVYNETDSRKQKFSRAAGALLADFMTIYSIAGAEGTAGGFTGGAGAIVLAPVTFPVVATTVMATVKDVDVLLSAIQTVEDGYHGGNDEDIHTDNNSSKNDEVDIPDGFVETKEFGRMHGQKVYKKDNRYISRDVDSHSGGAWKVFEKKGGRLKRIGTADKDLKIFKK